MKKLIFALMALLLLGSMFAVEFDITGEVRNRAAMYNDPSEYDGGHIDSRLQLRLDSNLHQDLQLGILFEAGSIVWGDSNGMIGNESPSLKLNEMYIDYMINSLNAKLRFGRQAWADNASLILDDNFNGLMLTFDDLKGYTTEFAFIKAVENIPERKDDHNAFFINLASEEPIPHGFMALYAKHQITRAANFTLMPYYTFAAGSAALNTTVFFDLQTQRGFEDKLGWGISLKADLEMGDLQIGGDFLFANKEGLTTLSPYYMNGLYIYGYGAHHDGVGIYWNDGYEMGNGDGYISMVGKARMPFSANVDLFGAAGFVMTQSDYVGAEFNGGAEYQVIEDLFKVSGFGALAIPESGAAFNYVVGVNATVSF